MEPVQGHGRVGLSTADTVGQMELVPSKKWIRSPKWTTTQAVKPWGGWERPAPGVVLNNGRSSIDSELRAMDTK